MNYTFNVSCLCVLYSLSLVSSQHDLPTDGPATSSPRPRALTPYTTKESFSVGEVEITAVDDEDGFSILTSDKSPSVTSRTIKPEFPESQKNSPITLSTRQANNRKLSGYSLGSAPEEFGLPSSPRHRQSPKIAPNTPNASGTILNTLKQEREKDGIPVTTSMEHSLAMKKDEPSTSTLGHLCLPPSAISTLAEIAVIGGLTQRRNSGSPRSKENQRQQMLNGRTNVLTTTPDSNVIVTRVAPNRYKCHETQTENGPALETCDNTNLPLTSAQQLSGHGSGVFVDPGTKTGPDHHVIGVESTVRPKPAKPSCFVRLCCCCFPCLQTKTKKR